MLDEKQKSQLFEEEWFRQEAKKFLDKKQPESKQSKIIAFLNTNFGLFALSTIFIGFFSWAYNSYKFTIDEYRSDVKNIKHLKAEIKNRFDCVSRIAYPYPGEARALIRTAIFGLNGGNYNSLSPLPAYSPVYTEFKERSIISLLIELRDNEATNQITYSNIDSAITFTGKLPDFFWRTKVQDKGDTTYYVLPDSVKQTFQNSFNAVYQRLKDL